MAVLCQADANQGDDLIDDADDGFTIPILCLACGGGGCSNCRYADCSICLGTSSSAKNASFSLQCGHIFCTACIRKHVQTQQDEGRRGSCPLCSGDLCQKDVVAMGLESEVANQDVTIDGREREAQCRIAEHTFRCAARKGHWKLCPNCGVAITKDGGCSMMRCRCGENFDWACAQLVEQCNCVHWNEEGVRAWGHICLGCSPITKAKLAAIRTGVCLCGIPLVTVVLATASVPAVVFAPLATIYEPVCRLRISKSNPFKEAMVQGSLMVIRGAANACEKIGILAPEDVTQYDVALLDVEYDDEF